MPAMDKTVPLIRKNFLVISPVYNEKEYVEQLMKSVTSQTIVPKKWILVDDGSTDGTGEILKKYESQYDFIIFHARERVDGKSYYYSKVEAFQEGYETVKHLEHDFVACLDGDITLKATYYEDVLREFQRDERLGIASGVYVNQIGNRTEKVVRDSSSTPGALQVFRRECYESIGGYKALRNGGEDALANIMARKLGWRTQAFSDYIAKHYRPIGVRGGASPLRGKFIQGLAEYSLGTHPGFMLAKSLRRMFIEKPYFAGSTARFFGFLAGYMKGYDREVSDEVKGYVRREQLSRLVPWRSCDK